MSRTKTVIASFLALVLLLSVNGLAVAQSCASGFTTYTVKSGDWLYQIGRTFGIDPYDIYVFNQGGIWNWNTIYPGQVLCIPPKNVAHPFPGTGGIGGAVPAQGTTPAAPACNLGNGAWNPLYIPRFWIAAVDGGKTVTILTENFPPGTDFEVRMGNYGTAAIGGTYVATTNSCKGGAFRATYNILDGLKGNSMIAIRMDNFYTGYYAFNYFYNTTAVAIP